MVNWCPASLTALSDEEVIMKPQKGFLYKVRYNILESPGAYVEVSTTRPETIVGDVALAIHPEDPRWKTLKGKHVLDRSTRRLFQLWQMRPYSVILERAC